MMTPERLAEIENDPCPWGCKEILELLDEVRLQHRRWNKLWPRVDELTSIWDSQNFAGKEMEDEVCDLSAIARTLRDTKT